MLEFPGLPGEARIEVSCIAYADKSKIAIVVLANPEVADKVRVAFLLSIPMVAISRWS